MALLIRRHHTGGDLKIIGKLSYIQLLEESLGRRHHHAAELELVRNDSLFYVHGS